MSDIIAAALAILAALGGAFIGQLWGRVKGERTGWNSAVNQMKATQDKAYRETRERADEATRHDNGADAREFLRSRQDRNQ